MATQTNLIIGMSELWDVLRVVSTAAWGFGAVIALFVGIEYFRKWKRDGGILPLHVWLISLAYQTLGASVVTINIERFGEPRPHANLILGLVGFTLGGRALWLIYTYVTRTDARPRRRASNAL